MRIALELFGRQLEVSTKALPPLQGLSPSAGGGWWPIIRESLTGAWQSNVTVNAATVLTHSAVFACQTLIASDLGKLCLRLVQEDEDGVWTATASPAFSPVLRKPNHYQTTQQFIETWALSLQRTGNTYVLKQRDSRQLVVRLYVLEPSRVTPLVTADGAVYYELRRDDMSGLPQESVTVPASEVMHDRQNTLYHPLIGVSPIFACGMAALQGLSIQGNSSKLFSNGSVPGGVLTAPGAISDETASRLKAYWDTNFTGDNVGKVAVLGDGLKYEHMAYNAVDMQLIEQLKWSDQTICSCHRVPPYLVDIGPPPPYANIEPVIQKYFSQCLQARILGIEHALDEGLGLDVKKDGIQYGTEFDLTDLIWMDMTARNKAAADGIGSGGMSPDEARKRFYGLGKVPGGDTPYLQQQYFSLAALAERDALHPLATPAPAAPAAPDLTLVEDQRQAAHLRIALRRKAQEAWRRRAA